MEKSKRKPVVSSRLPKAFSQPNKLRKRKNPDVAEAAQEYKNAAKLLSPLKLNQKQAKQMNDNLNNSFENEFSHLDQKQKKLLEPFIRLRNLPIENVAAVKALPRPKVKLDEMITIALLSSSVRSGAIRKTLHAQTLKLFVVKEVPISSRELRQELLDIVTPWHKAQKKYGHLLKVNSTFWNVPEGCVSFVLEYMSGNSLAKLVDSVGCIPEFILSKVIKEVSKGVGFVHYMIGPHGGISPSQVFFTRDGYIKIGLGLFKRVNNQKISIENDVFDIGHTTLIAALGGSDWFEQEQIDTVSTNCCLYHALEEIEPNPLFNRFSPNLKNFLCGCLQFDERRRLSLQEVIGHPWIVEKQMIGPKVRITELMGISYKWHTGNEVNYQAEKQLDRIFESLFLILDSEQLPLYANEVVRELAMDLGIEEELIRKRLNVN